MPCRSFCHQELASSIKLEPDAENMKEHGGIYRVSNGVCYFKLFAITR